MMPLAKVIFSQFHLHIGYPAAFLKEDKASRSELDICEELQASSSSSKAVSRSKICNLVVQHILHSLITIGSGNLWVKVEFRSSVK